MNPRPPYWSFPQAPSPSSPTSPIGIPGMPVPAMITSPGSPTHFLHHHPHSPQQLHHQAQFPFFLHFPQPNMFPQPVNLPLQHPQSPPGSAKKAPKDVHTPVMHPQYPLMPMPTNGLTVRSGVYGLAEIEAHMANMMKSTGGDQFSHPKPLSTEPPPRGQTQANDLTISPNVSSFIAAAAPPANSPPNSHPSTAVASPLPPSPTVSPPSTPVARSSPSSSSRKLKNTKVQTRHFHTNKETNRAPEVQRAIMNRQKMPYNSTANLKFVPKNPTSPTSTSPSPIQNDTERVGETPRSIIKEFLQEIDDANEVQSTADLNLSPQDSSEAKPTVASSEGDDLPVNKSSYKPPPLSVSKLDRMARDAQAIFTSLAPSRQDTGMRLALLARLQRIVNEKWPRANPKLHIFGSSANDMCLASGDIDICLIIDEDVSGPESLLVKQLGNLLERNNMKNVYPLPRARVPIVKFRDPMSRLSCDICINNPLALHNTRLVADYSRIDPRVRILSYLVKYWAKKRQVNNPYEGTLSSYAYINLVIFYLQTRAPPVLPCLQRMAKDIPDRVIVDEYDCTYFTDIESLAGFGNNNTESVAELLYGFFHYYSYEFDFIEKVVCIREGHLITKAEKGWSRSAFRENNWICIEDPFEVTHNLGRVCDKASLSGIRTELRRACKVLSQSGSFKVVCDAELLNQV